MYNIAQIITEVQVKQKTAKFQSILWSAILAQNNCKKTFFFSVQNIILIHLYFKINETLMIYWALLEAKNLYPLCIEGIVILISGYLTWLSHWCPLHLIFNSVLYNYFSIWSPWNQSYYITKYDIILPQIMWLI
jgi:hypothetical protein